MARIKTTMARIAVGVSRREFELVAQNALLTSKLTSRLQDTTPR